MSIAAGLRRAVRTRAQGRCEYCGLAQAGQEATFHIDHIVPIVAGGDASMENLALACVSCSLRKAARMLATDPQTGREVRIFHPQREVWPEHFRWEGVQVVGLTPGGRATVAALNLNRSMALAIRAEEMLHGRHPPPQ